MDPNIFPDLARSNGGMRNQRPAPTAQLDPSSLPLPSMVYRAYAMRVNTADHSEYELRFTPVVPFPDGSFAPSDKHLDFMLSPESVTKLFEQFAEVLTPEQKALARKALSDVEIPDAPKIVRP